nr:cytochrome c [uncultured Halomonas sp.]
MRHHLLLASGLLLAGGLASVATASAADKDSSLIEQGQYIARATDCMACHVGPDGTEFAGGKPISTPMGDIIAPNISSSGEYGIGNYSLEDLTGVLRNGKTPSGTHLYPAMPYPSYRGMTDEDVKALYAYLQTVPAVDRKPKAQTDLDFPFNIRLLMSFWNAQNLDRYEPPKGLDDQAARGQYFVDHLGHCGTCHTPRNDLMGSDYDQYLGGGPLGPWQAPNITSNETSGIGLWSNEQLAEYFQNGQMSYAAQAAGPMGEAVHDSLQYMSKDDRLAIAAYLKTVPALANEDQQQPVFDPEINQQLIGREPVVTKATNYTSDQLKKHGLKTGDIKEPDSPAGLYAQHCASCHGQEGYGQPVSHYASLVGNTTLRSANPRNLVGVLLNGVAYRGATPGALMPGFEGKLDNGQIASVANYVRTEFGGHADSALEADQVDHIASGKQPVPTLIRYAPLLAWLGIAVLVLLIAGGVWWWLRRRNQSDRGVHQDDTRSNDANRNEARSNG